MYNLLVVDDEIADVNGIAYDIDWSPVGISEIYKAYNGREALGCVQNHRIDIVIADIKMPAMNGLEMAREMKNRWPFIKIIFLTGYDEFKYAQEAVELGVFCYLTKPVTDTELTDTVRRVIISIEQEFEKVNALENAKKQIAEILPIMQEKFLVSWIVQGWVNPYNDLGQLKALNLPLKVSCPGFVLVIRMDEYLRDKDLKEENLVKIAIRDLAKDTLLKRANALFFEDYEGNQVALVQKETGVEELLKYAELMCDVFQKAANLSLHCVLSVFLGKTVGDLSEFHQSYQDILYFMHTRLTWDHGISIQLGKFHDQYTVTETNDIDQYPSFDILVETLQKEKALDRIGDIFRHMEGGNAVSYEILLRVYYVISAALLNCSIKEKVTVSEWAEDKSGFLSIMEHVKSVNDLKKWCIDATCGLIDFIIGKRTRQTNSIVEEAKGLIGQQFDQDVNIADISAKLYVNASYLSRLFKKETGLTIMDYIIKLRMDKAKKLLRLSHVKVYEVAQMVGYESQAHFNRIFKREVGVTPKDYQLNFTGIDQNSGKK